MVLIIVKEIFTDIEVFGKQIKDDYVRNENSELIQRDIVY